MADHEKYMKRALELATMAWGRTNPNPLVGAVIVKEGVIISEGFHEALGCAHAEISAFRNSQDDVRGATMYVNLEPCSHYGRTPPCADAIIAKGIKHVVVGMFDPNPKVSGMGIEKLKNAGIKVTVGVLEEECRKLNEIFIKYITKRKPFVIMKTAMTMDGKIASFNGDSKWITGEAAREQVHILRNRVAAVMVGVNTVLKDDPFLSTRLKSGNGRDAARIIADSKGSIPLEANVLNGLPEKKVIIATTDRIAAEKEEKLANKGAIIIKAGNDGGGVDLNKLMDELYALEIDSILLEGGGTVNSSALESGVVDKVMFFIAPKILGGSNAVTPVEGKGKAFIRDSTKLRDITLKQYGEDILVEAYIDKSNKTASDD